MIRLDFAKSRDEWKKTGGKSVQGFIMTCNKNIIVTLADCIFNLLSIIFFDLDFYCHSVYFVVSL